MSTVLIPKETLVKVLQYLWVDEQDDLGGTFAGIVIVWG